MPVSLAFKKVNCGCRVAKLTLEADFESGKGSWEGGVAAAGTPSYRDISLVVAVPHDIKQGIDNSSRHILLPCNKG